MQCAKEHASEHQLCKVATMHDERLDKWNGYNSRARRRWESRWSRRKVDDTAANWEDYPSNMLRRWKEHKIIRGGSKIACVDSGKFGSLKSKDLLRVLRGWLSEPCAGVKRTPKVENSTMLSTGPKMGSSGTLGLGLGP